MTLSDLGHVFAGERGPAGSHEVGKQAELVHVGSGVGRFTAELFWGTPKGNVGRSMFRGSAFFFGSRRSGICCAGWVVSRLPGWGEGEVEPKISNFHHTGGAYDDGIGGEPTVEDIGAVCVAQSRGNAHQHVEHAIYGHGAVRSNQFAEGASLYSFGNQVVKRSGKFWGADGISTPVVHRGKSWVGEVGRRLGLSTESFDESAVGGERRGEGLKDHQPIELCVVGQVIGAKGRISQLVAYLVASVYQRG